MLHHVALEVTPEKIEAERDFWTAVGFRRVEVPEGLDPKLVWLERNGSQIHLLPVDSPVIPTDGHAAIVAPEFEDTVDRLERAGFEVSRRREYWGAPRAKVTTPGGHLVELMAAPPDRKQG